MGHALLPCPCQSVRPECFDKIIGCKGDIRDIPRCLLIRLLRVQRLASPLHRLEPRFKF